MPTARSRFICDPADSIIRSHCHSAFNGPWPGMDHPEREHFLKLVFSCADFASVEIVAFSIGPRSFDLIVDAPRSLELSRKEMVRRLENVTAPASFQVLKAQLDAGDEAAWARLGNRFGDVSIFIKHVKELTAHFYHRSHGSSGTLWTGRYSRAFLQPGHASRILSAWFDHAAIRRGAVTAVDDDRFSTFGRAAGGDERARGMITALYGSGDASQAWRQVSRAYRDFIADDTPPPNPRRSNNGIPLLTRSQLLLTDAPQFRGSVAIGDEAFVEAFFQRNREEFGPNRKRGGHLIGGQHDPDLWTIRKKTDLRNLR